MKDRGYRVSFATHDSGEEWVRAYGLPFLSAGEFPITAKELRQKLQAMTRDASNFRGILTMFNDIYVRAARPMFDALLSQLDDTEVNPNTPDLLVIDIASVGAQYLAHKLEIPYILNSPSLLFDLGGAPSYVPAWGTGFHESMSLWNRCMNILFPRLLSVALTPPFMELNKMRYELDLPPFRSQHDLFKGARIILNTAFGLEHPQPLSPLVDAVGPIMPVQGGSASKLERQPLPEALMDWLNDPIIITSSLKQTAARVHSTENEAETGAGSVVYVNFGTTAYLDEWQAKALIEGLLSDVEDQPVKVLWILPADQHSTLPSSVPPSFLIKTPNFSLSNLEVLNHPAVSLVISHCGMVSAQEALVMGKPLLCIPFLVDQPDVAARVADSGAGILLDKNLLSASYIHAAVAELRTNVTYTLAAKKIGAILERAGGTTRAVEIIDAALRLGFDHLATLNTIAPWHKTALLDVWAVYAALICLSAVCVRMQWLMFYRTVSKTIRLVRNFTLGLIRRATSMMESYDEVPEDKDE
ncbi:hypothetical protein L915_20228 [Plasmopara halstedii]|uniref:Uncharacterized protein n=1 Tax=Plasmopara halstedii TaxID=4781 RepID=A0A0P1AD22_PLAHL|nr:hypothetical protein L915_20228 [Plasmopara halstedii]CEG38893.1 hypothetical protein L915_20228 [Plasmopara halstedii]|eukprot:XP_024575262.1 hypothetical protein L915_20228 [Plasmopara halstedii]